MDKAFAVPFADGGFGSGAERLVLTEGGNTYHPAGPGWEKSEIQEPAAKTDPPDGAKVGEEVLHWDRLDRGLAVAALHIHVPDSVGCAGIAPAWLSHAVTAARAGHPSSPFAQA